MKSPIINNLQCPGCHDFVLDKNVQKSTDSTADWHCSNCGYEMTQEEYEAYHAVRFKEVDDLQAQISKKTIPARKFGSSKK